MWARTTEFYLGVWLSISWIIFGYKDRAELLWHDFIIALFIALFSLFSYVEKLRHLHLLNFLVAIWLAIFSYVQRGMGMAVVAQNYMTLAWLIALFAVIPSHARRPPYQWIKFMDERSQR